MAKRKKRIDRGIKVRADSIYAVWSLKELGYLSFPRIILIFGLLILPLVINDLYWKRVICLLGIYGILSISLDFLSSFVGLHCLGIAFFVGMGGYISGLLNSFYNIPVFLSIPIATIIGAIICTIALSPTLVLRGVYFSIVSFMYPLLIAKIIAATGAFGGTDGITDIEILGNIWLNQYIILVFLLASTFFLRRLVNEDFGLILQGIRDNDLSILASGLNVTKFKVIALFIAAIMGCFSGAYLTHLYGWVGLSLFSLDFSIFPIASIVVGGPGTIVGALTGSIILVPIGEILRKFAGLRIIFYSLIIVFFIVFWSEGLLNWAKRKYEQFEIEVEI